MSKPQFILACDSTFAEIFYHNSFQETTYRDFLTNIQKYITIRQREWLEKDNNYKQILPYTVFRLKGTDRFVTYQRTNQVGESRLAGNSSIGYGGHIDLTDVAFDDRSVINVADTIFESVYREIHEELKITGYLDQALNHRYMGSSLYILNDNSNEVGEVHLGIVRIIDVDESEIIGGNEDELIFLGFKSKEEILDLNPENWTKIILENL